MLTVSPAYENSLVVWCRAVILNRRAATAYCGLPGCRDAIWREPIIPHSLCRMMQAMKRDVSLNLCNLHKCDVELWCLQCTHTENGVFSVVEDRGVRKYRKNRISQYCVLWYCIDSQNHYQFLINSLQRLTQTILNLICKDMCPLRVVLWCWMLQKLWWMQMQIPLFWLHKKSTLFTQILCIWWCVLYTMTVFQNSCQYTSLVEEILCPTRLRIH